jgi:hypothetical protein
MKTLEKIFLFAPPLLVVMFLFLVVVAPSTLQQSELSAEEKALIVMTDVIGLDLTKYNVEHYNNNSRFYDGLFRENVDYTLEANGSKIQVLLTFHNCTLIQWSINTFEGSPIYAKPLAAKPLDVAKETLRRYQEYANVPIVQEARDVLDFVTDLKTTNVTLGDLKMRIYEVNSFPHIDWVRAVNGLDFTTGLDIRFTNGILDSFTDRSSFFKIGSADVNISRDEAVRIALTEAKTYSSVNLWGIGTFRFRVKEEPFIVQLQVGTANFTMYPYWDIWFPADPEVYSITGVKVYIRADTGEITYSSTTQGF